MTCKLLINFNLHYRSQSHVMVCITSPLVRPFFLRRSTEKPSAKAHTISNRTYHAEGKGISSEGVPHRTVYSSRALDLWPPSGSFSSLWHSALKVWNTLSTPNRVHLCRSISHRSRRTESTSSASCAWMV